MCVNPRFGGYATDRHVGKSPRDPQKNVGNPPKSQVPLSVTYLGAFQGPGCAWANRSEY